MSNKYITNKMPGSITCINCGKIQPKDNEICIRCGESTTKDILGDINTVDPSLIYLNNLVFKDAKLEDLQGNL